MVQNRKEENFLLKIKHTKLVDIVIGCSTVPSSRKIFNSHMQFFFFVFFLTFFFFFLFLLRLSTFKPLNALYSKFDRLKISERTCAGMKSAVPGWKDPLNQALLNFALLSR